MKPDLNWATHYAESVLGDGLIIRTSFDKKPSDDEKPSNDLLSTCLRLVRWSSPWKAMPFLLRLRQPAATRRHEHQANFSARIKRPLLRWCAHNIRRR
jgi:hypothetical protein